MWGVGVVGVCVRARVYLLWGTMGDKLGIAEILLLMLSTNTAPVGEAVQ